MHKAKLCEIDFKKEIIKKLINAKQLQNSFFFQDSISYYLKALHIIEENKPKWDISEILMEIGFSYYYMPAWSKSEDYFKQSLDARPNFEVTMFIIIVFIKLRKIELAKSAFKKVNEIFNVPPDIIARKEYTWLVDILNFLKAEEIQEFIAFKELLSHDIQKLNFVSSLAVLEKKTTNKKTKKTIVSNLTLRDESIIIYEDYDKISSIHIYSTIYSNP